MKNKGWRGVPISQVILGIKNKRTALEKDFYVMIMNGREVIKGQVSQ